MKITTTIEIIDFSEFNPMSIQSVDEKQVTVNLDVEGIVTEADAKFLAEVSKKLYHAASEIKAMKYTKQ